MKDELKLNLAHFDGESAGDAGASMGDNSVDATQTTGEVNVDAAQTVEKTGAQDDAEQSNQETKPTFDDLIRGEYKKDFDARVQDIIAKRLKADKQTQSEVQKKLEALSPLAAELSAKYGVAADDYEGLKKALYEDNNLYEDAAAKHGMTTDQYKQLRSIERENEMLRKNQEVERVNSEREAFNQKMNLQIEEAKKFFPNMDVVSELQNPQFASLIKSGVDVKTAYQVLHNDEIMAGAMARTAQEVKEKVSNNILAGNRPTENGVKSNTAITTRIDVSTLNRKQMDAIDAMVARGEKIDFSNLSPEILTRIKGK